VIGTMAIAAAPVASQQPLNGATTLANLAEVDATAGSMSERTFLLTGLLAPAGVSTVIRPLTRRSRDSLFSWTGAEPGTKRLVVTSPVASIWLNSRRAAVDRDGAVWQGRGVTMAVSGGAVAEAGPLSASVRPLVAWSSNADYAPVRGPRPPDLREPFYGSRVDLPYRFGEGAYALASPGESWISLNAWRLSAGGTSASQAWGPAHYYPLVLGTEAAGYPRLFAEARGLPLGLATMSASWSLGRLESSPEIGRASGDRSRFASAMIVSLSPTGFRGLEAGVTRFFHGRLERGWLSMPTATLPFARLFKAKDAGEISSRSVNQLASVFARLAPPGAGVEAYFEFLREDHNADVRDLFGEPDHASGYTVGFRRAWRAGETVRAITLETTNGRISHLARVRVQQPLYVHDDITEGHTHLGQPLGSTAVLGGGAYAIAYDIVGAQHSRQVEAEVRRVAQNQEGGLYSGYGSTVASIRVTEWRDRARLSIGASVKLSATMGLIPGNSVTLMLAARGGRSGQF